MAAEVAEPEDSVTIPREVTPLKNSTDPVAVPAPGETGATVAVGVPKAGVFAIPRFTTWLTTELVLVAKLESPEYTAVML